MRIIKRIEIKDCFIDFGSLLQIHPVYQIAGVIFTEPLSQTPCEAGSGGIITMTNARHLTAGFHAL